MMMKTFFKIDPKRLERGYLKFLRRHAKLIKQATSVSVERDADTGILLAVYRGKDGKHLARNVFWGGIVNGKEQ